MDVDRLDTDVLCKQYCQSHLAIMFPCRKLLSSTRKGCGEAGYSKRQSGSFWTHSRDGATCSAVARLSPRSFYFLFLKRVESEKVSPKKCTLLFFFFFFSFRVKLNCAWLNVPFPQCSASDPNKMSKFQNAPLSNPKVVLDLMKFSIGKWRLTELSNTCSWMAPFSH